MGLKISPTTISAVVISPATQRVPGAASRVVPSGSPNGVAFDTASGQITPGTGTPSHVTFNATPVTSSSGSIVYKVVVVPAAVPKLDTLGVNEFKVAIYDGKIAGIGTGDPCAAMKAPTGASEVNLAVFLIHSITCSLG